MGNKLRKAWLNFGWRALRVLGAVAYLRYLGTLLVLSPRILRERNLRCVDKAMGRRMVTARCRGRRVVFDCPRIDELIRDGSYCFGLVRELFIRDCYLRHVPGEFLESVRNVVDLGANRGTFSAMVSPWAKKIVAVEVLAEMGAAIAQNMRTNGFENYRVVTSFIGAKGDDQGRAGATISMTELLDGQGLETVDLMKMDIEGSEFALFEEPGWLGRVRGLTMEIHPRWGDPGKVVGVLREAGFEVKVLDQTLEITEDCGRAEFLCALRK
ncbi:MAG: FkbM family methyltransferase [Phycisphaeraceae bacterium]|nr:FkbM family methyltransferase [Phycisphaeraceae bacterium]